MTGPGFGLAAQPLSVKEAEALDALRRVVANEGNHYDRYWTPAPEPLTEEWLSDTEAKMRDAVMLTLIAEIRRLRGVTGRAVEAAAKTAAAVVQHAPRGTP